MFRTMMNGKIHRATVTESNLEYVGSITIDANILEAVGMVPMRRYRWSTTIMGLDLKHTLLKVKKVRVSFVLMEQHQGLYSQETS